MGVFFNSCNEEKLVRAPVARIGRVFTTQDVYMKVRLVINRQHNRCTLSEELPDGQEFVVAGDPDQLRKQAEQMSSSAPAAEKKEEASNGDDVLELDDDEPMCVGEVCEPENVRRPPKRHSEAVAADGESEAKRRKTETES